MMDEMNRILSDEKAIAEAKSKWEYYIPRIIKQAQREKGKKLQEIDIIDEDSKIKCLLHYYYIHYCKIQGTIH